MPKADAQALNYDKKTWWERVYVLEIARGMAITISHLIKNIAGLGEGRVGITYQCPETPMPIDSLWKGEHRLMHREDGTPRCVACNCCSTACPADCIAITASDTGHDEVEKFPIAFDIDILQCVFCGLCVEACPCDAIRMDTGKFPEATYEGPKHIFNIDYLMNNHPEGKSKISEAIY
ncbi:MAG: 4Fe-4S binding protein [Candidatus Krumholzibacteria bacterium]|nr:4Fe-4S binding protein [Candidatus Krumholzibacteria bacterium]